MTTVVSVQFNDKGKGYYFDPAGLTIAEGDKVIVETSKGAEFGTCIQAGHDVDDATVVQPLRPVLRLATEEDVRKAAFYKAKEPEALEICREKIEARELDMKLVDVEYGFDGSKITFFFTSDGRVDFRELVKDLAAVFKTRVELRQIGIRDEARMLGGLGICGRPFCCAQFLDDFQSVSIKMAKTQGLSLNPTKISGTCGRLMCCLKYEQEAYEDLSKNMPKVDSFVQTPAGKGLVLDVNLLRSTARVRLDDSNDSFTIKTFNADELEVLGGKAKRAEYLTLKADGKLPPEELAPKPKASEKAKPEPPAEEPAKPENERQESKNRGGRNQSRRPSEAANRNDGRTEPKNENRSAGRSGADKSGQNKARSGKENAGRSSHAPKKTGGEAAAQTKPETSGVAKPAGNASGNGGGRKNHHRRKNYSANKPKNSGGGSTQA